MPETPRSRSWLLWCAFVVGFAVALLWLRRIGPQTAAARVESTAPATTHAPAAIARAVDAGRPARERILEETRPRVVLIVRDPSGALVTRYSAELRLNEDWAQTWVSEWPAPHLNVFEPGVYSLAIESRHFLPYSAPVEMPVKGPIEVTLTPAKEFEISGVVVSDAPLPAGERVRVLGDDGFDEFDDVPVDAAGHFVAHVPTQRQYDVTFHDERIGAADQLVTAPKNDVQLSIEARAGIRLRLPPSAAVRLSHYGGSGEGHMPQLPDRDLHDGEVLLGLPEGSWSLGFTMGDRKAEVSVELKSGQIAEVSPDFSSSVVVRGRIVDSHGAPVPGVFIERPATPVGSDGRFEATLLSLGDPLFIVVPGKGHMEVETPATELGDIVFSPDEDRIPLRHVSGRVVDALGNPVASFDIDNAHGDAKTFSDGSGAFEVELEGEDSDPDDDEDPPEPLELKVRAKGFLDTTVPLAPGQTWVEVTLAPALSVRGRVVDAAGNTVPSAKVSCNVCEDEVETDASGSFSLAKFEPAWPQLVHARSGQLAAAAFTSGEPLTLQLGPPVAVQVELPLASGVVEADGDATDTKLPISSPGHASGLLAPGVYTFSVGNQNLMPATAVPGLERNEALITGASMTVSLVRDPESYSVSASAFGSTEAP